MRSAPRHLSHTSACLHTSFLHSVSAQQGVLPAAIPPPHSTAAAAPGPALCSREGVTLVLNNSPDTGVQSHFLATLLELDAANTYTPSFYPECPLKASGTRNTSHTLFFR
ncbi:unnamed protein product [Pleuronectes platessa]|uniref:Uncharacterized protein n=1 Tax=Pleuronectes platessa TaxID=8262 RepID=A0A9N7VC81_PLEPL|nr:unnamed protein product [Pleuronectes platessa]